MGLEFFSYDSPDFKRFLRDNPHENGEVKFLKSILEEGMNVIDVGGYIGVTTVVIANKIRESGRLYSFEPVQEYFDILKRNISSNELKNVEIYRLLLSDHIGKNNFYKNNASSSIVPQEGFHKLQVNTTTIDSFLKEVNEKRINLINMDCEGSELYVLQGAEDVLSKQHPIVFCEVHHEYLKKLEQSVDDIVNFLKSLNYTIKPIQVENLDSKTTYSECSHICASIDTK